MADTAAHLVDRVLPEAPIRQYVLSLPFAPYVIEFFPRDYHDPVWIIYLILLPGTMVVSQPSIPVPLVVDFPFPPWATRKEEVAEDGDPFEGL